MMTKLKQLVNVLLGLAGLEVRRVPRQRPGPPRHTQEEIESLRRDLHALKATGRDFNGWDSPPVVLSYLTPGRIDFFHELIDIAERHGVTFAGRSVLDVGTCTGYLLRLLGARFPDCRLHGTDVQEMFVNLASCLAPRARIARRDLIVAEGGDRFDVVFCTEVLEHVLPSEESLPRLLRLLRPGGTLVLTVPDGRRDLSPAGHSIADGHSYAGHVNFWGAESWRYYVGRHADGRSFDTGALDNGEKLYAVIHDRRERAGHDTDRRA